VTTTMITSMNTEVCRGLEQTVLEIGRHHKSMQTAATSIAAQCVKYQGNPELSLFQEIVAEVHDFKGLLEVSNGNFPSSQKETDIKILDNALNYLGY
jgi:hypothetical protein